MPKKGLLLDANVWRYIVDADAFGELLRAALSHDNQLIIAPSVVYEAFRDRDLSRREKLLSAMTINHKKIRRLMPEAFTFGEEILNEIKRLRPEWLRDKPILQFRRQLKNDWRRSKAGFWHRARHQPDREIESLGLLGHWDEGEKAFDQAKIKRGEGQEMSRDQSKPLNSWLAEFLGPAPGWKGDNILAWRAETLSVFTFYFSKSTSPYHDWIGSHVDIETMMSDRASWNSFWLYHVDSERIPSIWLIWAFEFLQRFKTVNIGTPADAQLASYCLQADFVVSADKGFIEIVKRCRKESHFTIAEPMRIRGGDQGVRDLLNHVAMA